ncbi:hypothetical protein ACHAQA_002944 [Verticillium albo-atrum]
MPAIQFVPARDSRHRHACLALYRALVREGRRIPLPADVLANKPANPVQHMIKRQFRRNRGDTAPRIVFAALTAGYKFLSLFRQAQSPSSTAHAEILAHLRRKHLESTTQRANHKHRPPRPDKPALRPKPPPLLTRHQDMDGTVTYTPSLRPVPASKLRGRRRIPTVYVTAHGVPYLRVKKPQPVTLERSLRLTGIRRQARVTRAIALREEAMPAAKEEDRWERLVEKLQLEEGRRAEAEGAGFTVEMTTFSSGVQKGWEALGRSLQNERLEWVARTEAYVKIVEEETRMSKVEAGLVELPDGQWVRQRPAAASDPSEKAKTRRPLEIVW